MVVKRIPHVRVIEMRVPMSIPGDDPDVVNDSELVDVVDAIPPHELDDGIDELSETYLPSIQETLEEHRPKAHRRKG